MWGACVCGCGVGRVRRRCAHKSVRSFEGFRFCTRSRLREGISEIFRCCVRVVSFRGFFRRFLVLRMRFNYNKQSRGVVEIEGVGGGGGDYVFARMPRHVKNFTRGEICWG
jgi:hypothetical protein